MRIAIDPNVRIENNWTYAGFEDVFGDVNALTPDDNELPMWVVYDHPSDYPQHYVARQHVVGMAGPQVTERTMAHAELAPIRAALANLGLVRLDRNAEDDPVIVEVWL